MAVTRDDLGRAARKRGIEGQVTAMASFAVSQTLFSFTISSLVCGTVALGGDSPIKMTGVLAGNFEKNP